MVGYKAFAPKTSNIWLDKWLT